MFWRIVDHLKSKYSNYCYNKFHQQLLITYMQTTPNYLSDIPNHFHEDSENHLTVPETPYLFPSEV
jgi:hypothetical protein